MNRYLEILLGLILIGSGAYGIWFFRDQVMVVIEGCVGICVLLIGLIFLLIGVYEI